MISESQTLHDLSLLDKEVLLDLLEKHTAELNVCLSLPYLHDIVVHHKRYITLILQVIEEKS